MNKILKQIVIALLVFTWTLPSLAAESTINNRVYTDIPLGHWSENYVRYMVEQGYMALMENNTFEPDRPTTRSEVVNIVIKQAGLELADTDQPTFSDVSTGSNLYLPIETAVKNAIVKGYPDGTFRADQPVTRAQFLKILFKANQQIIPELIPQANFYDVDRDHWAASYIYFSKNNNLVKGFADGNFRPTDLVTRAQVAKIIYLYLEGKGMLDTKSKSVVEPLDSIDQQTLLYEKFVLNIINISRSEIAEKTPLVLDPELSRIARLHARYLSNNDLRSEHTGSDGLSPFDRIQNAGISYISAAENIGWASANTRSIAETLMAIHTEMMNLPDTETNHRTNILGLFQNFNKIGIGVVISDNNGSREVRVVQKFIESK